MIAFRTAAKPGSRIMSRLTFFWLRRAKPLPETHYAAVGASSVYTYSVIRLGYPAQTLTVPASTNHTLQLATLGYVHRVRALVWETLVGLETIFAV
jgi:hypothetical protein